MAEAEKKDKKTAVDLFREKLTNRAAVKETVMDGLKNTNAKVRSLAVKAAFKLKDKAVIKSNVLPLIKTDKSKKVLRTLSRKVTRKELHARVKQMTAAKKAAEAKPKEEAPAAG